jgi:hypothetical protein
MAMEFIFRLMDRIGWERVMVALLHSLWEGALIGVVVWILLRQVTANRARLRYGIAVVGLLMVLVGVLMTFEIHGERVRFEGAIRTSLNRTSSQHRTT